MAPRILRHLPAPHSASSTARSALMAVLLHPLMLLLLLFICNAMLWALVIPRGNGPDELAHIDYIEHLALHGTLPIFGTTPQTTNPNALNPQAMQPPLYYLLATPIRLALAGQPVLTQLAGIRAFSVLIGAATVGLSYWLGRILVPRPQFALCVAALVACTPMFTFVSAYVTNDGLATLLGVAVLIGWAQVLRGAGWQWLVGIGALIGLGIVTKFSILPIAAVTGLLLVALAWRAPQQRVRKLIISCLLVAAPVLLIGGWSLVRNWQLYGDPTTLMIFERFPEAYRGGPYRSVGSMWEMLFVGRPYFFGFWDGLFHGFWGIFDFYVILLSQPLYHTLDTLLIVGALGGLVCAIRLAAFCK